MTAIQRTRYEAAHLCALQASGTGETLSELGAALGMRDPTDAIALARREISASIGHGNWREVRAEAEAKLRRKPRRSQ